MVTMDNSAKEELLTSVWIISPHVVLSSSEGINVEKLQHCHNMIIMNVSVMNCRLFLFILKPDTWKVWNSKTSNLQNQHRKRGGAVAAATSRRLSTTYMLDVMRCWSQQEELFDWSTPTEEPQEEEEEEEKTGGWISWLEPHLRDFTEVGAG